MFARASSSDAPFSRNNGEDQVETDGELSNNKNINKDISDKAKAVEENNRDIALETGAIDEHYVCDISMMRIVEEGSSSSRSSRNNNKSADDSAACAGEMAQQQEEYYVQDYEQATNNNNNNNSNANDLEIDRQEEEQAVSDLVRSSSANALMEADNNNSGSMRVVFGILVRLVLPLANGVARGIQGIRDVRVDHLMQNLASSRQMLTNLVAFAANTISMNLSSVQVSNRIGPLLNLLKLRKSQDGLESLPDTPSLPATPIIVHPQNSPIPMLGPSGGKRKSRVDHQPAPNCCTLNILAEPPAGTPIRADIVFMHGLHGSQVNTWKQGLWENERRPVEFERPPLQPVRPPKRARHSRSAAIHQAPREKRAKFAASKRSLEPTALSHDAKQWAQLQQEQQQQQQRFNASDDDGEDYAYVCGAPKDIQICGDIEYSFPPFRVLMPEKTRLSMLQSDDNDNTPDDPHNAQSSDVSPKSLVGKGKRKQSSKPSAKDPNYSKCWPGDWLPLDCPGVRVIAVNYTTDQYLWRPLWKGKEPRSGLVQRSREMAELLIKHRVGYGHPIIYVGHSKGGLFIKQLIVDAWECGRPAMTPLWRSARGCFFYSVPHRGSHLASIKAPLLARSVELLEIEKNNKYLLDLHRRFSGLYHMGHLKIEVFSFVETALTLMSVLYLRIVGVDSADPGIGDVCGIRLDHREICKPRGRDCILYKELVKMIEKVC
ncbi:uncharacterized protein LOC115620527 [Scaptodrosophila lebanonensis]|uniref:Uncharacterized protein LOC115620527 n=1 Tax=Drosophila lebanonensis TaxID=7225 RepID=A0A6J2SYJ8_DROLE|nr:uncharacterized protein LOC115620527 [Scaptodrosophila lebanonensis]